MKQKNFKPYFLIRSLTGEIVMQAAYVRYLLPSPYCLVFQEYPAKKTTIMVCRNVSGDPDDYGNRTLELRRDGEPDVIDYYVSIGTKETEKEAVKFVDANMAGGAMMQRVLEQYGYGK